MSKLLSILGAGAALALLPMGVTVASALPVGGIVTQVHGTAITGPSNLVIRTGSGKTKGLSDRRKRGARDAATRAHYFTREKIIKDYYGGHIPPEGVSGPVIYTYRWFDNGYGGRR